MNSYLWKTRMHIWRALRRERHEIRERFRPVVELFRRIKYPRSIDSFSIDASEYFFVHPALSIRIPPKITNRVIRLYLLKLLSV